MSKKDSFKEFIKTKPELIKHVEDGTMTWQKYYEIYDLYGEDENAWIDYLNDNRNSFQSLQSITKIIKNIDVGSLQKHIDTAQKAIGVVQDLTTKPAVTPKGPSSPRPLNKFFED